MGHHTDITADWVRERILDSLTSGDDPCADCGKPVDQTLVALDPQPKIPEWCEEGNCNLNATSLEGEWGTRHAWGYAHGPDEDWTEHAWLVTPEGFVIDPTWLDTGPGFEYAETEYDPWEATTS